MKGFTASPRLLLLAALALPGLAPAQDASPVAEASAAPDPASAGAAADAAPTQVETRIGRLVFPGALGLRERSRFVNRVDGSDTRAGERLQFVTPAGDRLTIVLAITPAGQQGAMAMSLSMMSYLDGARRDPAVDAVEPVTLAGESFHVLRYAPRGAEKGGGKPGAVEPADEAPRAEAVADGDSASGEQPAVRELALTGMVKDVMVLMTVSMTSGLVDAEDALVEALSTMAVDPDAVLAHADGLVGERGERVTGDGVSTMFGVAPRDEHYQVTLLELSENRTAGGESAGVERWVFTSPGAFSTQYLMLELYCGADAEEAARISTEEVADAFAAALASASEREPRASTFGPLPARRWSGRSADDTGVRATLRIAQVGGESYIAKIRGFNARRLTRDIERWLDDAAVPQCPAVAERRTPTDA